MFRKLKHQEEKDEFCRNGVLSRQLKHQDSVSSEEGSSPTLSNMVRGSCTKLLGHTYDLRYEGFA